MREANFQSAIEFRTNRLNSGYNTTKNTNKTYGKRGKSFGGMKDKKIELEEESKLSNIITQVQKKNCGTPTSHNHLNNQKERLFSASPKREKKTQLLLPEKDKKFYKKKTLVLDLDETLVHSGFLPFNPSDIILKIEFEGVIHDIHVLVRPYAEEFLKKMAELYEIVIFTASLSKYADPLLNILDKKKSCQFRLFREHCTMINGIYVKDLRRLNRDLKDIIIVDNSPLSYAFNTENGFPVVSWYDDKTDNELERIVPILEFLSGVHDVTKYIPKIITNNEVNYDKANLLITDTYLTNTNKNNTEYKDELMIDSSDIIHKIEKNFRNYETELVRGNYEEDEDKAEVAYYKPSTSNSSKTIKMNSNNSCKNMGVTSNNNNNSGNVPNNVANLTNSNSTNNFSIKNSLGNIISNNTSENSNNNISNENNGKLSKNHFRKNVQNLNINIGKSCPGIRLYKYDANLNEQNPKKIIQNDIPTVKDNTNTTYNEGNLTTSKIANDDTNINQQTNGLNVSSSNNIKIIKKSANAEKEKKKKNFFRKGIKSLRNENTLYNKNPKMNVISSGFPSNLNQLSYSFKTDKIKAELKNHQPKSFHTKNNLTSTNKIFTSKFISPTSPLNQTSNRPQTSNPTHVRQLSLKDKKLITNTSSQMLYRSPSSQIVFFNSPLTKHYSTKINIMNGPVYRPSSSNMVNFQPKKNYISNRPKSTGKISAISETNSSHIIRNSSMNMTTGPSTKTPKNNKFTKKIQSEYVPNTENIHNKRFSSNTTRHKQFISSSGYGLNNLGKMTAAIGFTDNLNTSKLKKEKLKVSNSTRVGTKSVGKKK